MADIWQIEVDIPQGGNNPGTAPILFGSKGGSAWEEQAYVAIKGTNWRRSIGAGDNYSPIDLPPFGRATLEVWGEYKRDDDRRWYRSAIVGYRAVPQTFVSEENPMYRSQCFEIGFRDDIEKAGKDPRTVNLALLVLTNWGVGDVRVVPMERPAPY